MSLGISISNLRLVQLDGVRIARIDGSTVRGHVGGNSGQVHARIRRRGWSTSCCCCSGGNGSRTG